MSARDQLGLALWQARETCVDVETKATFRTAEAFQAALAMYGAVEKVPLTGVLGGRRWVRRWFIAYIEAVQFAFYAPDTYETRAVEEVPNGR